jgi:hypothetical protein
VQPFGETSVMGLSSSQTLSLFKGHWSQDTSDITDAIHSVQILTEAPQLLRFTYISWLAYTPFPLHMYEPVLNVHVLFS